MSAEKPKRKRVKPNRNADAVKPTMETAPASKEASGPGEVDPAPAQGGAKGSVFGALNASKKESLFDDDDDVTETAAAAPRISVNKEYASRHAHNKKREELHRLQEKYGADYDPDASGSSSSDTEDEDAEALTRTVEKDFFSTLAKLKSNHPSIRDPKKTFFAEPTSDDDGESNIAGTKRDKKAKPFNLRDHERMRLETKGELAFVSDDEGEEAELAGKSKSLAFDAEQRKLRQSLVKSLHGAAEADEGSAEDGEADDFFRVRGKTSEEQEAEDADYAKWLRDEGALDQEEAQELEPLRRFWTDPNLSEADRFLRDYITNRKWRSDEPSARAVPRYDEVIGTGGPAQAIDLDEDEEHVEQMEEFEQGYNFRFQEEGATEIEWFPRDIEGSLRKKKNKRQEARLRASERREEEKVTKSEEIKRLKNLKKEEILNKLKQLQDLSGHAAGGLEAIDLEGEFDPEEYDKQMASAFNDDYYEAEADETKPVFPEEEWEEDYGQYDEDEQEGEYDPEGDLNMDADFLDAGPASGAAMEETAEADAAASKKMSRAKLKLLEEKIKSGELDEAAEKDPALQKQLEEYFSLDYEDIVGGIPTRFKYRTVEANDFGLTTEEILAAEDKELNRWASLKKMVQYRKEEEERKDVRRYKKRRTDLKTKREVFSESEAWAVTEKGKNLKETEPERIARLARERKEKKIEARALKREQKRLAREAAASAGEAEGDTTAAAGAASDGAQDKKSHKERRREERKAKQKAYEEKMRAAEANGDNDTATAGEPGEPSEGSSSEKKRKRKEAEQSVPQISAERLRAYGSGGLKADRARLNAAEKKAGKKAMQKSRERGKKSSKKRAAASE